MKQIPDLDEVDLLEDTSISFMTFSEMNVCRHECKSCIISKSLRWR